MPEAAEMSLGGGATQTKGRRAAPALRLIREELEELREGADDAQRQEDAGQCQYGTVGKVPPPERYGEDRPRGQPKHDGDGGLAAEGADALVEEEPVVNPGARLVERREEAEPEDAEAGADGRGRGGTVGSPPHLHLPRRR